MIAALLAGCSMAPAYVRPALPTAPVFPEAGPSQPPSIAQIGWHAFFTDPELRSLISAALANNRDLRIAIGQVDLARASFQIQGAQLYPTLDGVGSFTRTRTSANFSASGQAFTKSEYQSVLSAGWEIDVWGRLRNLRSSALENYLVVSRLVV